MPPPPTPSELLSSTDQILRSLEEVRDSLAQRVEELSLAVDRLRSQAGLLERRTPRPSAISRSIMPTSRRPRSSSTPAAPQNVVEPQPRTLNSIFPADLPPVRITPSPIPERPLSNEEIHLLLDRASQPPVNPSPSVPEVRFEETLERLRTTRRRIREMQTRTTTLGDILDHDIAPRIDAVSGDDGDFSWDSPDALENALLPRSRHGNSLAREPTIYRRSDSHRRLSVYDSADDALAAANDYLSSVRADPMRVPTRRDLAAVPREILDPEVLEDAIRGRFISSPAEDPPARSRTVGCRPTNVQRLRQAPTPEIVRSTPPSPASTITPEVPPTALPIPIGPSSTPSTRRLEAIRANPRRSIRSRGSTPLQDETPTPMTFGNSSLAVAPPTSRRRRGDDEALTFRGMDVNARMNDPDAPRTTGTLEDSVVTDFLISFFSRLSDDAENIQPQAHPPNAPRLAHARIPSQANGTSAALADAEERLAAARRRLVQLDVQAEQEEADRRERRGVLGVSDVLRGLGEGLTGPIGSTRHRERSAQLTSNGEGSGPRNERPEDVDTVVHIRQFQENRDATRQRLRDRLRELSEVRRAADDVYQARRAAAAIPLPRPGGTRRGHDLAYWADQAREDETIFDATRRALSGAPRPQSRPETPPLLDGVEGVFVTVSVQSDPTTPAEVPDSDIVESMRRQFESLGNGSGRQPELDSEWMMQVIGPNGQVLQTRSDVQAPRGGGGMDGTMERLALAIVQSAEGSREPGAVLEGSGEARNGAGAASSSAMTREASQSSTRAVEGVAREDYRGSKGVRNDVDDRTPLIAQPQLVPAPTARRERPYISMLDL